MALLLKKLMDLVKGKIKEISIDELSDRLDAKEDIIILDVRSREEWDKGHIPGAIHCDRGMLELKIENLVNNTDSRIVVCCGGGTRSALCTDTLERMGYKNVESLAGGFRGWCAANLPIEN